jgi:putative hydrolase of the HAD superfamily
MSELKLISFDAADTLIKLARSIGDHYASVASRYAVVADIGGINKSFKKVFAETPPLGTDGRKGLAWWSDVIQRTFAAEGLGPEQFNDFNAFVSELYQVLAEDHAWTLYPDAEPTLNQLKERGYRLIVFSNFDERLIKVLEDLKIKHYFERIICSTQIGLAKPDSRAFNKIAELVGLKPQKMLHVGDGFENDYLAALKADWKALFLNRNSSRHYNLINPKYQIKSLLEVIDLLNAAL